MPAVAAKESFQFPTKVKAPGKRQVSSELGRLLWRLIQVRPEFAAGQVKLFRDSFLRDAPDVLGADEADRRTALRDLLLANGRYLVANFDVFLDGVLKLYERELAYRKDRARQFSIDILFQTIELISLNKTATAAEGTIRALGQNEELSVSEQDRANMLLHFRAYLDVQRRIGAAGGPKQALQDRDALLVAAARANPDVAMLALGAMLRNFIAQEVLAKKFSCDTLMVEWMKEYGFGPLHILKLSRLIPMETALSQFRLCYANAMRSLREAAAQEGERIESDMFLLRSISNFYTSWTMRVAEMVPA